MRVKNKTKKYTNCQSSSITVHNRERRRHSLSPSSRLSLSSTTPITANYNHRSTSYHDLHPPSGSHVESHLIPRNSSANRNATLLLESLELAVTSQLQQSSQPSVFAEPSTDRTTTPSNSSHHNHHLKHNHNHHHPSQVNRFL